MNDDLIVLLLDLNKEYCLAQDKALFISQIKEPSVQELFYRNYQYRAQRSESFRIDLDAQKDFIREKKRTIEKSTLQAPPPLISAAIIVKDEEGTIENAILSIYDIADEICILDTGSTDKTVEICKGFPKVKLKQQEITPWDFSKARNINFAMCSGRTIFYIDADEMIMGNQKEIRSAVLERDDNEVLSVTLFTFDDPGNPVLAMKQMKFFHRDTVTWHEPLHNQASIKGSPEIIGNTGIAVYHYPYMSKKKQLNRELRNSDFEKRYLKMKPSMRREEMLMKLYLEDRKNTKALKHAEIALKIFRDLDAKEQKLHVETLLMCAQVKLACSVPDVGEELYRHSSLTEDTTVDNAFYTYVMFETNRLYKQAGTSLMKHLDLAEHFELNTTGVYSTIRYLPTVQILGDLYDYWMSQ